LSKTNGTCQNFFQTKCTEIDIGNVLQKPLTITGKKKERKKERKEGAMHTCSSDIL
jgi:hypothetical protein